MNFLLKCIQLHWDDYTEPSGESYVFEKSTNGTASGNMNGGDFGIEAYEFAGAYAGAWGNSTASINIYSSGEEDGAIGNIFLYLDSQIPVYGGLSIEGMLAMQDMNLLRIQYEDAEILLDVSKDSAGSITIALYINDEYVESYFMTEQYIS